MAITQSSIMNQAFRLANQIGVDGHDSPIIDGSTLPEDLFSLALRAAVIERSTTPGSADGLKRSYTLNFVNGKAAKPDTMLDEVMNQSQLYSAANPDVLISFQPRYLDFIRPAYNQLGYYTLNGDNIEYKEPYGNAGSYTGTQTLVAVGLPDIPASLTDPITMSTELAESVVWQLVAMMRGQHGEVKVA